ncbi:hypothetical protein DFH07DRAFT_783764 [Mycena maculata]|uniref:Uncharacterized protein n=1 Tax=Mycena maculata TaxID=230809 RepID=A0AAD7HLL5_9AGAR|nr:hypothetical protein DFH07DRAFT_783764 [Mycena maculata]
MDSHTKKGRRQTVLFHGLHENITLVTEISVTARLQVLHEQERVDPVAVWDPEDRAGGTRDARFSEGALDRHLGAARALWAGSGHESKSKGEKQNGKRTHNALIFNKLLHAGILDAQWELETRGSWRCPWASCEMISGSSDGGIRGTTKPSGVADREMGVGGAGRGWQKAERPEEADSLEEGIGSVVIKLSNGGMGQGADSGGIFIRIGRGGAKTMPIEGKNTED